MSEYQLELKQIVDYPRCRIYRQFIKMLMQDKNIRTGGSSGLYYPPYGKQRFEPLRTRKRSDEAQSGH